MCDAERVEATLSIEINVTCPNDECAAYINLLRESETDSTYHDDDNALLGQVLGNAGWGKFECDKVVCTKCKTKFDVKGMEC